MRENNKKLQNPIVSYIIIAVKVMLFYYLVELNPFNYLVGVITYIILLNIYYIASNVKNKYILLTFFLIYIFITIAMFLDALYYKGFLQYTTLKGLFNIDLLDYLGEQVTFSFILLSFILFFDLPIFYFIFYERNSNPFLEKTKRPKRNKKGRLIRSKWKYVVPVFVILLVIGIVINPLNIKFVSHIHNMEFFTYHLRNATSSVSNQNTYDPLEVIKENVEKTNKARYKGIGKNKNLILIQVKDLQNFVINASYNNQEITPNLNQLIKTNTLYFKNYYQNMAKGNLTDAEFSSLNGIYPITEGEAYTIFKDNLFKGMPAIMKENGYSTNAYYGGNIKDYNRESIFNKMGFDRYVTSNHNLSDKLFLSHVSKYFPKEEKPMFNFIMLSSSNKQYTASDEVTNLELLSEDQGTLFGDYLTLMRYQDEAIGDFINQLKAEGKYEDTMIVIYGAKHGLEYNDKKIKMAMKDRFNIDYTVADMLNSPLIMHIPSVGISEDILTVGGQVDLLPTIINIMDLQNSNPYLVGQDIVNIDHGFTVTIYYSLQPSFIKDDVIFQVPRSGSFEKASAYSLQTKGKVNASLYREDYKRAENIVQLSKYLLSNKNIK